MTFLRNCWQVAAYGREVIAGRIMVRRIANEPLILFRTSRGKLVAMEDRCPHRSAPLSKGTLLGEQGGVCSIRSSTPRRAPSQPGHH